MALEKKNYDVPLYVGMGESGDAQSRDTAAVVSENVSFDKTGSVSSRPATRVVRTGLSGTSRLVPSESDILLVAGSTLNRLKDDNSIVESSRFEVGRDIATKRVPISIPAAAWVRCVPQGTNYLMTWLVPDTTNGYYTGQALVVDGDFLPRGEPVDLGVTFVKAGSELVYIDATTAVFVAVSEKNIVHVKIVTGAGVATPTTPLVTPVSTTDDVISPNSCAKDGDVFTILEDGPASSYLVEYDTSANTAAVTDLYAVSPRYNIQPFGALAVNDSNVLWAVTEGISTGSGGVGITLDTFDPVANTPTSLGSLCRYTTSANAPVMVNSSPAGFDNYTLFDGDDLYLVSHGIEQGFMGTVVRKFDTTGPTLTWEKYIPMGTIFSEGWVDADGVHIPVVFSDGWLSFHDVTGAGDVTFITNAAPVDDTTAGQVVSTISGPLYSIAGIATLPTDSGEFYVHSFFGQDEVTNHSNVSGDAGKILRVGATVDVGGQKAFVHCRQVEPVSSSGDSRGLDAAGLTTKEGSGCSIHVSILGDLKQVSTAFGGGYSVVSNDLVGSVQGGKVVPTSFPVPPRIWLDTSSYLSVDAGATFNRNYKACFAMLTREGIRIRGPMSHTVSQYFQGWTLDSQTEEMNLPPFPRVAGLEKVFIEVYADTMASGAPADPPVLVYTFASDDYDFPSTYDVVVAEDTDPNPIAYTYGGVLPNEPQVSQGDIVFSNNRIWTLEGSRAFYSKTRTFRNPVSFNRNLYVDSPDGRDFTGVASLDGQTVLFTEEAVYMVRGSGVNDLGTGNSFTVSKLTSPSGCVNGKGVAGFDEGVLFAGQRGMHLLARNLYVSYVGADIEDTLDPEDIQFTVMDRQAKEVLLFTSNRVFAMDTRTKMWTVTDFNGGTFDHVVSLPDKIIGCTNGNLIFSGSVSVADDELLSANDRPAMKHSTPWVELDSKQGFQRAYEFLVQGKAVIGDRFVPAIRDENGSVTTGSSLSAEHRTFVTFKVFLDHESDPSHTLVVDLRTMDSLDPLEIRVPVGARQKCRAARLQIETDVSSMFLRLSSVVLVAGVKGSGDKRQTTQGT